MELPVEWTGTSGHVLHEPFVPQWFRDGLTELISELERAAPVGLVSKRKTFRTQGQFDTYSGELVGSSLRQRQTTALVQLLNERVELLVGLQLLRAGALQRIRTDTPDFDCCWQGFEFGVEVTTRARQEVGAEFHDLLEDELWEGPDVLVTVTRSDKRLFSAKPEVVAEAADRVVEHIKAEVARAGHRVSGSVPLPALGLGVDFSSDAGIGLPGARVVFQPLWPGWVGGLDHHWEMAARQIKDKIEKDKGRKTYSTPSILVLDVSRLGETGRLPWGMWTMTFQQVLDRCELGNLRGVLLVRTTLDAQGIHFVAWRGEQAMLPAVGLVLAGDQIASTT